jgi:hypothetical protein
VQTSIIIIISFRNLFFFFFLFVCLFVLQEYQVRQGKNVRGYGANQSIAAQTPFKEKSKGDRP